MKKAMVLGLDIATRKPRQKFTCLRGAAVGAVGAGVTPRLDAEPDQIGGADPAQDVEQYRLRS